MFGTQVYMFYNGYDFGVLEENLSPHHMKIKSNKKNCCVLNGICE
jgi:hypothetical protein